MEKEAPIGVFDSGLGGLSIWQEIVARLPKESTHYVADSQFAPYGTKETVFIVRRATELTEFLLEKGCKLIVVACNTATTTAIQELRKRFNVPFIGIEPAIKPAALHTQTGKVGVLATKGTLSSQLFHRTKDLHTRGIAIIEREGAGLVEAIESGDLHAAELRELLQSHLHFLLEEQIDVLVLGCTHYPFLLPLIRELLPPQIEIIDSGEAVARQTEAVLKSLDLISPISTDVKRYFYSSGDAAVLESFLQSLHYDYGVKSLRS